MNDKEIMELQRLIDQGILLAQTRLVERAKHEGYSLVVRRNGVVSEVPAVEINIK